MQFEELSPLSQKIVKELKEIFGKMVLPDLSNILYQEKDNDICGTHISTHSISSLVGEKFDINIEIKFDDNMILNFNAGPLWHNSRVIKCFDFVKNICSFKMIEAQINDDNIHAEIINFIQSHKYFIKIPNKKGDEIQMLFGYKFFIANKSKQ